jgi:hypothetical protein
MFSAYTTDCYSPSIDFLDESEREVDPTWLPPLFGMTGAPLAGIDLSAQFESEKVIELYDDSECPYDYYDHEETLASGTTTSSSHRIEDSCAQQVFDINTLYSTAYPDFSLNSSALSSLPSYSLPMPSPSSLIASTSVGATLRSPGSAPLSPSSPPASSTPPQPLLPSSPAIAWPLFDPSSSPLTPPPPTNSPTTSHRSSSPPHPPPQTQNASGGFVGLKPAIEEKKKKEKTQPKACKKQQGPKPRSKPQAKGRGSTSQACKQNWEALLQGTQLKDETMLKGKWYWHLRGKAPRPHVTFIQWITS